jgi:hypothetical protein
MEQHSSQVKYGFKIVTTHKLSCCNFVTLFSTSRSFQGVNQRHHPKENLKAPKSQDIPLEAIHIGACSP